jgi:hypothetical protein
MDHKYNYHAINLGNLATPMITALNQFFCKLSSAKDLNYLENIFQICGTKEKNGNNKGSE